MQAPGVNKNKLYVIKRSGETEAVSFDKITERIQALSFGLDMDHVDPALVAQRVAAQIVPGTTTQALDEQAALVAGEMAVNHPDYALLAGRICASNLQKTTTPTFSEAMTVLYEHRCPDKGEWRPLVSTEFYEIVQANAERLDAAIRPEQDLTYPIFAMSTLKKSYLLSVTRGDGKRHSVETPQYLHRRVAIGVWKGDLAEVLRMYSDMSEKTYIHSTPTLFHVGSPDGQLASCFLLLMAEDSVKSIFKSISDTALISKYGAGIGLFVHDIRSSGSYIAGTAGRSSGTVPMLCTVEQTLRFINQAGHRAGSASIYLELHHLEILEFLAPRRNTGADDMRCPHLFTALWTSQYFMQRVANDEMWPMFDPTACPGLSDAYGADYAAPYERYEREGRAARRGGACARARSSARSPPSLMENSAPYILDKDACNEFSNQKNLGTIKSSTSAPRSSSTARRRKRPSASWPTWHCRASCAPSRVT